MRSRPSARRFWSSAGAPRSSYCGRLSTGWRSPEQRRSRNGERPRGRLTPIAVRHVLVGMQVHVSGKHVDVGEALRVRVSDELNSTIGKYFDRGGAADVV